MKENMALLFLEYHGKGCVNMKFLKRNQIIISVIALMLITAGYFNYIDNIETLEASSNSIYDLD